MAQDDKKQVEERRWPFVVHEEPGGRCRHDMVPEWCAICSPRGEEKKR
jgi:hypothetical protein